MGQRPTLSTLGKGVESWPRGGLGAGGQRQETGGVGCQGLHHNLKTGFSSPNSAHLSPSRSRLLWNNGSLNSSALKGSGAQALLAGCFLGSSREEPYGPLPATKPERQGGLWSSSDDPIAASAECQQTGGHGVNLQSQSQTGELWLATGLTVCSHQNELPSKSLCGGTLRFTQTLSQSSPST